MIFTKMTSCTKIMAMGHFLKWENWVFGHTSRFSMGNDISDINNDGWSDIITLDMKPYEEVVRKKSEGESPFNIYEFRQGFGYQHQYIRNMLQLNQGTLFGDEVRFSEIGQQSGIAATEWSWSPIITDLDNDGWKDLYITNGIPNRPNESRLYQLCV